MKARSSRKKTPPKIIIIAGPNGAGKTTFAEEFLVNEAACNDFINADLIARGLSPFEPERAAVQAGKIMLAQIADRVSRKESFSFETTLSGRNYASHITKWQELGYQVKLFFLSLPTAEFAVDRVQARVVQGGHHVPEDVIRRRFVAGISNFNGIYRNLVDRWILYDNSGPEPKLMAKGRNK